MYKPQMRTKGIKIDRKERESEKKKEKRKKKKKNKDKVFPGYSHVPTPI